MNGDYPQIRRKDDDVCTVFNIFEVKVASAHRFFRHAGKDVNVALYFASVKISAPSQEVPINAP